MNEDGKVRRFPDGATPGNPKSRHPSVRADRDIPPERDPMGRMALFSSQDRSNVTGTLLVDCSACRRETPVAPMQLVRSAFPFSVHLPLLRKYHSFMRCPSCGRRTWVRVRWQV